MKTTEGPMTTTEGPMKTTEGPMTTTEGPMKTTEGPMKTTEGPMKTTEDLQLSACALGDWTSFVFLQRLGCFYPQFSLSLWRL